MCMCISIVLLRSRFTLLRLLGYYEELTFSFEVTRCEDFKLFELRSSQHNRRMLSLIGDIYFEIQFPIAYYLKHPALCCRKHVPNQKKSRCRDVSREQRQLFQIKTLNTRYTAAFHCTCE